MRARIHPTLSHGLSRTPEYRAWQTARHRCTSPASPAWPAYGGRGITMCAEWLTDPAAFIADAGFRPSRQHELDRRDNNRGYEPGNVHWVSRPVNDRNRRSNRLLEHDGVTRTVAEWAEHTTISAPTILARLGIGWSADRALTTPVRGKAKAGADTRPSCLCCGARCYGARCQSCENRTRPRGPDGRVLPARTAKALVRALLEV